MYALSKWAVLASVLVIASACGGSSSPSPTPITVSPATASVAPRGSLTFSATGGSGTGFTWSLSTNASGGSIVAATGVYTAGNTGSVTDVVRVTDSAGNAGTRSVSVTAGVSIAPASATAPPRGTLTFTASGGSGAGYTWALATNASGGTIDANSGVYVAGATGSVTDVVQATDSAGNVATRNVAVTAGVAIAPASASVAPRGTQTFLASGGSGTGFTWTLLTNASGGSIDATSGAYVSGGTGGVTDVVRVVDSLGNFATADVSVGGTVTISPATASAPPRGSLSFTASGGSGTGYQWALSANPSGGSINASTGAYVAGATGGVTDAVRVVDSIGNAGLRNVTVTAGVSIAPGTASVAPGGTISFSAAGGSGTGFAWSLTTNVSGGTINPSTGAYRAGSNAGTDVVSVSDSLGNTATRNVSVTASLAISGATTIAPRGSTTFSATGGSGSGYTWSISTNNSGGAINSSTGAYTAGATPSVTDTVRVVDSASNSATRTIAVGAGVSVAPATVTLVVGGTQTFAATGGSDTGFQWSLSTNASGGSINASTGAYTAGSTPGTDVVRVVDSLGNAATRNVTVAAAVAIAPASLTVVVGGTQTFTATGGSGTGYQWSLSTNASGGSINASTGAYTAGSAPGTDVVRVVDSLGNAATRSVTVVAAVAISPASVTVVVGGTQSFTASGGVGPYTWSLTTNGSVTGTINPTTGAYTAGSTPGTDVVRVVDSLGNFATRNVTVVAAVSISPASVALVVGGTQAFTATGGVGPYTWSVSGTSGGTINASGLYTAGPNPGTDVVRAQDTLGNAGTRNVAVTTVVQRWASPTTWGGTTSFWDDADPLLVEHATFDASGNIHETKGTTWGSNPGVTGLGFPFPGGTRYGAGPFSDSASNYFSPPTVARPYQAVSGDGALNLTGDMLVCAVVKPDWNPGSLGGAPDLPDVDGHERVIMAKGVQGNSGWVLMQMHTDWCFHWQDGTSASTAFGENMNWSPTTLPVYGPGGPPENQATLNPSYVVVCGGRDTATNQIIVAANSFADTRFVTTTIPGADVMQTTTYPTTIGAYASTAPVTNTNHVFNGRVYETAVWNEPATAVNVQAKMAAVLGLALPVQPDGTTPVASYTRETEAPYPASNGTWFPATGGQYHTAWRHQPRFNPTSGMLIGLQGLNRVSLPESFGRWSATAGASVSPNVSTPVPPGDSERPSADQVILGAGAGISIQLGSFRTRTPTSASFEGPVQGQLWVYPISASGTLRIRSDAARVTENRTFQPAAGTLTAGTYTYQVTALNASAQQSAPSVATTITLAAAGGVNVRWRPVKDAVSYNVYGRVGGSIGLLASGITASEWVDSGAGTPGVAPPVPTWTTPWDLGTQSLDLSTLTPNRWTRVYVNQLSTTGFQSEAGRGTLYLENPGASSIQFYSWGAALTQVSGGWPTAAQNDPGPTMYDTLTHSAPDPGSPVIDVFTLPPVTTSTAGQGFCLSVDAAPAAGLAWNTVLDDPRTLVNWRSADGTQVARLIIGGVDYSAPGQFIFRVTNTNAPAPTTDVLVHGAASFASETSGAKHTLRACVSQAGAVEIYAEGTLISGGITSQQTGLPLSSLPWATPDLLGGRVSVGSDGATPFHGYLSKALACTYTTNAANCQ
jgi:hypothetical protein